jgi:predicted phage tail component-like protein
MLSIDGIHIENDLGLHLLADSSEPMLPTTRDVSLTIPGKHGAYVFDSYFEPRTFIPKILIPSQKDLIEVQKIVRQVATLLVDENGKPKDVKLIYDYEPDKWYTARFSGYISIDRIAKTGIFSIPFTAYDPYAYREGGFYEYAITSNPLNISIENDSHFKTDFKIYISGQLKNVTVSNGESSLTISDTDYFTTTDEVLVIDTEAFSIYKVTNQIPLFQSADLGTSYQDNKLGDGVKTNMFRYTSGDFFKLKSNLNSITISGISSTLNKVIIEWKEKSL